MADPTDPGIWKQIAEWMWLTILPLIKVVYTKQEKRMDSFEETLKDKAENTEMNRQRGNIEKLFDGQRNIEQTMAKGFGEVISTMHGIHTSLLQEISKKADK